MSEEATEQPIYVSVARTPDGYDEFGEQELLGKLYGALAKAQGAFTAIHRSKTVTIQPREGRAYSFGYAPLEDLIEATRPALAANGLTVLTPIAKSGDRAKVLVIVAHEAGGRIMAAFEFVPQGDMKAVAGQITYLKRYGYSSMLCLSADDDADDEPAIGAGALTPEMQKARSAGNGQRMHQDAPETKAADPSWWSKPPTEEQLATYQRGIETLVAREIDVAPFELPTGANGKAVADVIDLMRTSVGKAKAAVPS